LTFAFWSTILKLSWTWCILSRMAEGWTLWSLATVI